MSNLMAKDGQFWLDGKPILIQAGEFHYFRTPREEWQHRLGLLKAAGFNAVAAYMPWLWHQVAEGVSDFDGHSHPMRDLAGFLDLAAEMDLFVIARPGPYIMAETINEGIPPWVFEHYPQVAFISQDGKVQNIASYLHPDFQACIQQWYREIFKVLAPRQITRGGKIILMQLDNEMGMMPWVRNILDTNPDTMNRFAAYLRARYGEDLPNHYPADDLAVYLQTGILHPQPQMAAKIVEDYRRFYRAYLREYAIFLWNEARAQGMEVLPVINIHGFANGGKTFPIGLSQLIEVMEIEGMLSATDVYPGHIGEGNFHQLLLVNEMTKALHNPQQPLFSIEFQAGGNHDFGNGQSSLGDLHSRLCISSGMRAINHYLFFDGENDPLLSPVKRHDWGHPVRKDGTLRKHYHRYPLLSSALKSYGEDLILSQLQTVTTVGFLLDTFMTEVNNEFSREAAEILTHQREVVLFDMIGRGLALTHRPFKAIELSRGALDPTNMPTCWVMMEKQCPAEVQQKLVDYVMQGGRLIIAGRMCIEDLDHNPCTILQDALGIRRMASDSPLSVTTISAFGYRDIPVSFVETYDGEFDEVFAHKEDGTIVGFIKKLDEGKVLMLGAAMAANTLEDLDVVNQMALKMECPAYFRLSDWADVRFGWGGNGGFLFINNYQDDPLETTVEMEKRTLFGGNVIQLPARSGLVLPVEWQFKPEILIHYCTSEIRGITEDATGILMKTAQNHFVAELTVTGYTCEGARALSRSNGSERLRVEGKDGEIVLTRL